jgi:hypothetical protein
MILMIERERERRRTSIGVNFLREEGGVVGHG